MSFTDPSAEPAQPAEGQGEEASGGSPWESYLDRIPEDARDVAAEAFREMEANANKKFESHAEFRKQWEPLQDTGVHQRDPGQVSWAMQFLDALDKPDLIKEWFDSYAQEHGLTAAQQAEVEQAVDDFGFQDPQQLVEKLLEERLGPLSQRLEQFSSRFEQQDQAQALERAGRFIDGQIGALEKEHGQFDNDTKELINTFAARYIDSDPMEAINRGFADYQKLRNDLERQALQGKLGQPPPAESGGVPDVNPEEHKRINDPAVKNAALEYMRNLNRA